jgi:7-cyano-7-deazaguanine synthase
VHAIALGTLKGNPFPDSSREFFDDFAALVQRGLGHSLEVRTPFAESTKADVLELGRGLSLQHTFSCIDPQGDLHCGRCNKCAERRLAFAELKIDDVTEYAPR